MTNRRSTKCDFDQLNAEILREFPAPVKEVGLDPSDFWWSAHCHLSPEDYPSALGHNMRIILRALVSAGELPDRLRDELSLMFLGLEVAPDAVLRDENIPLELKREFIKTEMRQGRRETYEQNLRHCSQLSIVQRGVVLHWLECLHVHDLCDEELLQGWRAFCNRQVPENL